MKNLTEQLADLQRQEETLKLELCKEIFNIVLHCPQPVEVDGLLFESPDFNPTLIRESMDTLSKIHATLTLNTNNLL